MPSTEQAAPRPGGFRDFLADNDRRQQVSDYLDRYFDVPLALASILLLLLTLIQLGGQLSAHWRADLVLLQALVWAAFAVEFLAQLLLAPRKLAYVRHHWGEALLVLLPFFGFLRVIRVAQSFRVLGLLVLGRQTLRAPFVLLRRRRLGQLAVISALVIPIGAALALLAEASAPGANIKTFGDALWWAVSLTTTVGSEFYPVTTGGRVVAVVLMLYGLGIFSYLTSAIASLLISLDAQQGEQAASKPLSVAMSGIQLTAAELDTLRAILARAEAQAGNLR